MTNRADFRQLIRDELNDNGAVKVWSDAVLNGFILEGLHDYGRQVGGEKTTTLTSVASQQPYALTTDVLQVVRVEHPPGFFRVPSPYRAGDEQPAPGRMIGLAPGELVFEVWGGNVILSPAPSANGESIVVRYVGAFAEPANDLTVLDVPTRDEPAITYFACARALRWIATDESKRQRFERQRGSDPSDAAKEYRTLYEGLIAEKQRARVSTRRLVPR